MRRYMAAIEDIFNIPQLIAISDSLARQGRIVEVLDEIIRWSNVEFDVESVRGSSINVVDEDEDADLGDTG